MIPQAYLAFFKLYILSSIAHIRTPYSMAFLYNFTNKDLIDVR